MADSFEEAARLDTPALRALLDRGRPEERVWAIWALALRTGGVIGIAERAATEPNAGVRRTLAVMLASHGETDLLVALARHDPEVAVRESAMQLVTRLAAGKAIAASVVTEAAQRDPAVRAAILAAIDRGAPAFLVGYATEMLASGPGALQAEAFEAMLRIDTHETRHAAHAWLVALDDARVRDACGRMLKLLGEEVFAATLAGADRRLRVFALGVLVTPQWSTVEQLVAGESDLLADIVRRRVVAVPAPALAKAVLDGQAWPFIEQLHAQLAELATPDDALEPLLPQLDRHYADWIAAIDRELVELHAQPLLAAGAPPDSQYPDDEAYDDALAYAQSRADARERLDQLRQQLARLMRAR